MARAIHKETQKASLDWRLVTAIFFQESSLKLDPQNCVKNVCQDFGLGQVRLKVWGDHFNIDQRRILADVDYSVYISVKVLKDYKKRYGSKELNWFTRYHSNKPELRFVYMQRLNQAFQKINLHVQEQKVRQIAAID
jgi:hypothetical protein